MPTSGDLKSGNSISCTTPTHLLNVKKPPPQPPQPYPTNQPAPKLRQSREWLRTLHEVLHEVHTIKICIHHRNDEIVFVND